MDEKIYTVSEFAKKLGCNRGAVLRMIKYGKIQSFRLGNSPKSSHRIKASEIDRMISEQIHIYKKQCRKEN